MNIKLKLFFLILLIIVAGTAFILLLNAQEPQIIAGIVQDEAGEPITGAVVRLRGSDFYTRTDNQGHFALKVDADEGQLTAWAPGYYIGGSHFEPASKLDGSIINLKPHPTEDNVHYEFISPMDEDNSSACSHCHRDRSGEMDGAMPLEEWLQDAHSQSATNPRFLSLYNGTNIDGDSGSPTTYHFDVEQGVNVPVAPSMGSDQAGAGFRLDFPDQSGSCATCHVPVLALEDPYNADPNHAEGVAAEGVTCDFCHKIQDVRLLPNGLPASGLTGVLSINFLRPHEDEQVFIGPFDDTPGDDIYSSLMEESQVCAACHSGQFWDVPIYNSFGEWLESPYNNVEHGQTCQDCHMPHSGATMFVQLPSTEAEEIPPRNPETIFSHQMPGAADQTLLEDAVSLNVKAVRSDEELQVTVQVTNIGAGHHIPTDNPLRQMILLVQAVDMQGQPLVLVSGSTIPTWGGEGDPENGYYAGLPGVIYAKILADFYTGEIPSYAYWRQTRLVSDNRIPALASDETAYAFDLPVDTGTVTIDVQLYLRRAFIELMDIKGWNTPDILMKQEMVTLP